MKGKWKKLFIGANFGNSIDSPSIDHLIQQQATDKEGVLFYFLLLFWEKPLLLV
jgi:hypothetical protein